MKPRRCPCGENTSPDPSCDMCDGWQNDPDTGWGGFTDHYLGKHFDSEKERDEYRQNNTGFDMDDIDHDDDDMW